jgi:PIN domain nuclease of toxin-antitoxin system
LDKLDLKGSLEESVRVELTQNGFNLLPLALEHIYNLKSIGFAHKDPFDRMIISQAMVEDLTIVTADPKFSEYAVKLLW